MFKNLFKPKATNFVAPFDGRIMPIEEVPDPVFSEKAMGDGFAIEMQTGEVYSPVNGEVIALFPTGHAIGIKSEDRNQYLIHLGLNTVNFKGEGFTTLVEVGQKVKQGELISKVDLEFFKKQSISMISPIIVTNANQRKIRILKEGSVKAKESDIIAIIP